MSEKMISAFKKGLLIDKLFPKTGITTGNNDIFLRYWSEVDYNKINKKWFKLNKGGSYRKWYGNNEFVIDWEENGKRIKNFNGSTIRNEEFYFKEGVTWGKICSGTFSARYSASDRMFDAVGLTCFTNDKISIQYMLGFFCSKVADAYAKMMNPTLSYTVGTISNLPFIHDSKMESKICTLVNECLEIAKTEYDSYENSIDFKRNPLLNDSFRENQSIEDKYKIWTDYCQQQIEKMREKEIAINDIFIKIYNLQEDLHAEVDFLDITLRKTNLRNDICALLSYAVGCMFGRYSLKKEGLMFAGGKMEDIYQFHSGKLDSSSSLDGLFPMDGKSYYYLEEDDYLINGSNIIPITDEEYLEDDIVSLLCTWLKKAYGQDTLEENLDFIASVLDNKGNTSREVIRNYFLKDFFKDHCTTYSVTGSGKRPIYWLFDSGKQNGFKALIYMHRYNTDTIGTIRVDYLHRMEQIYESEINRMQDTIDHSNAAREITTATKRKEKLQKQLKECREFDEKIGHLALSRIEIDLDDGVKVNYEKIQTADDGKKYQVLAKI